MTRPNFLPKGLPACRANACRSGRDKCPTPDACRLPDEDGWNPLPRREALRVYLAIAGACAVPALILAGVRFGFFN